MIRLIILRVHEPLVKSKHITNSHSSQEISPELRIEDVDSLF